MRKLLSWFGLCMPYGIELCWDEAIESKFRQIKQATEQGSTAEVIKRALVHYDLLVHARVHGFSIIARNDETGDEIEVPVR